jgi:hypothetical protein
MMSIKEFAAFETLDLAPIKMKLMHVESGEGWSALRADAVETEYRRFLFLMKKYPDAEASPTVDVDTFWHYHILDTLKYARDCEALFGYFLHHYPYVGIGAGADEGEQVRAGERMREIYAAEFGAAAGTGAAWCTSPGQRIDSSAWCTSPGKAQGNLIGQVAAWCTSPGKPREAANAAHAWCTSPGKGIDSSAWCTSPGQRVASSAWCTSPGKSLGGVAGKDVAWCTSPGKPFATRQAANAWCTSPGAPAATAWCTSPGKQSQQQPEVMKACAAAGKELAQAA